LRFLEQLSARLLETEAVVEDFAFKSVPARLAGVLLRLVETEQDNTGHTSHQELADMIAAYRETVTLALDELQTRGGGSAGALSKFWTNGSSRNSQRDKLSSAIRCFGHPQNAVCKSRLACDPRPGAPTGELYSVGSAKPSFSDRTLPRPESAAPPSLGPCGGAALVLERQFGAASG
jgi:hypothetical protein